MTLTLGLDLSPGIDVQVGDLAQNDIRAPRALTYTNEILTQQARDAGPRAVESAVRLHVRAGDHHRRRAARRRSTGASTPLDTAFAPETIRRGPAGAPRDGPARPLRGRAHGRSWTLEPDRWAPLRTEAARVLDVTERAELRDTEVAQTRERLSAQMAGGLSDGERSLAAELIAPLLVPNSSFSATLTAAGARPPGGGGPAGGREHRPGPGARPRRRRRSPTSTSPGSAPSASTSQRPTSPRSGAGCCSPASSSPC